MTNLCPGCDQVVAILVRQVSAHAATLDADKSVSISIPCPMCRALWTLARPGVGVLQLPDPTVWKLQKRGGE
jgi:hypothetical protein